MKKVISMMLTLVLLLGLFAGAVPSAHAASAVADATLSVDLNPAQNTGEIIHGAAGFLYGVSSEDVPTTNTIVPLKSKILCTKGAVGTEHPYGDALDVAKTFLESGGQQVMMYNSNYYGVFGVTATIDQYCNDLKNYICPAVLAWKNAWKQEHGTSDNPKDNFGALILIRRLSIFQSTKVRLLEIISTKHGKNIIAPSRRSIPRQRLRAQTLLLMVHNSALDRAWPVISSIVLTITACQM